MNDPRPIPPEFQIGRHMMSLWVPQALYAAAELGIADALAKSPASGAELASRIGTDPDATTRLANGLAVLGLLEEREDLFHLTDLGHCLRDDSDRSRRAWARLMGGPAVWRAWSRLADCVRTGKPAWTAGGGERSSETETFDALFQDPDSASIFHRAMADGTRGVAADILAAVDLREARTVVDVGGGHGALLAAALDAHPHLRGEVFDLEHARQGAEALFTARNLEGRARFTTGDLFRDRPPSADVLLMKSVIHDWNDERSLTILRHAAEALKEGARLVVVEPAAQGAPSPAFAWIVAFSDLNMLVNTGGKERTAAEYESLLGRAELRVTAIRAAGFYSCFEAVRA